MALWNGLGQAATVAQLGGIDAAGLISMIVQAVQTVKQNKVECRQLVNHVMMIKDLLGLLQQSEMMQRPEVRRPIDGLEDTLRQAYLLVVSCQDSNIMYRFVMAGSYAQQFRDVRDRINLYLHIYPLISHLDTRQFIRGLYNGTDSLGAQPQASEEALGSFIYDSNPGSQTERSIFGDNDIESVGDHAVIEPLAVEEQQHDYGYQVLPNRRHRFRWLTRWARRETSTTYSINRLSSHETGRFIVFEYSLLVASTNNFSFKIGSGGYGNVYKGTLPNGVDVALKVRREAEFYESDFENEVKIVPELRHANIVKLLGCCVEGENEILVYEHMPGGSLYDRISEVRSGYPLTWPIRFRIIEGIVEGLVYLHKNSSLRVIHGDVKTSNILLDVYMTPRITDFGNAHVLSSGEDEKMVDSVRGTIGYIDPQFMATLTTSVKTDVYNFGVTLLEIITTRPAFDLSMHQNLVHYAWELWLSGREMELLDPSLRDEPRLNEILRCIQIAMLCVQLNKEDRPTMFDVLMMLKCESTTLPIPTHTSGEVGSAANTGAIAGSTSYGSAELLTEEHDETSSYFSCCSSDQDNDDTSL